MLNIHKNIDQLLHHHYAELEAVKKQVARPIDGMVISGSGLNAVLEQYPAQQVVRAEDIPSFPRPSVAGHSSLLRFITIEGKSILHFTGRCHLYEGFSMRDALAQVGLGVLLGAKFAVLTNSAGGLQSLYKVGDVMLIAETINLLFRSVQREMAVKPEQHTDQHRDQHNAVRTGFSTSVIDQQWREAISAELTAQSVPHHHGTYIAVTGPTYETPAEARMYRRLGGQAIGMSTVPEAEFARICGLRVAACSLITNTLPEALPVTVSHDEVVHAAHIGALNVAKFIAVACKTAPV